MEEIFDSLIALQKKKVRQCAEALVPGVTDDDLLQPNDFAVLENSPHFRYNEGVLEGLMSARMAYLARVRALEEQ